MQISTTDYLMRGGYLSILLTKTLENGIFNQNSDVCRRNTIMSKMSPLDLARKLRLSREVIEQLSAFTVPEETATRLQEAFRQDPKVFEIAAREYENSDLLVLSLYLRWAMDTHFLYAIRGMDWGIFDATFRDLTECCQDFFDRTGKAGLNHWEWIGLAIKMQLFRLGKLEFRPNVLKEELTMEGQSYPAGTKVLEVWFPSNESLDDETIEETLARGKEFFEIYYRQEYEIFLCHSSFYRAL